MCCSKQSKKQGKLIICSAPSGSGKTTLVKHLLEQDFNLCFSVSATSRPPRGKEKEGVDYYFLTAEAFKQKIEEKAFVEWEQVYKGVFYGTLKKEVYRLLEVGKNVIFDVDVLGGLQLKKHFGDHALALFIVPPSIPELERRLRQRATDEKGVIAERVAKASYELSFKEQFDAVIINENLEEAQEQIEHKVREFIKVKKV